MLVCGLSVRVRVSLRPLSRTDLPCSQLSSAQFLCRLPQRAAMRSTMQRKESGRGGRCATREHVRHSLTETDHRLRSMRSGERVQFQQQQQQPPQLQRQSQYRPSTGGSASSASASSASRPRDHLRSRISSAGRGDDDAALRTAQQQIESGCDEHRGSAVAASSGHPHSLCSRLLALLPASRSWTATTASQQCTRAWSSVRARGAGVVAAPSIATCTMK